MKALCRSSPAAAMSLRELIVPSAFIDNDKIENYFCRIKDWRRIRALRPKELQWVHA